MCTEELCGESSKRTFVREEIGTTPLTSLENAYAASFMDFDEDGILDILLFLEPNATNPSSLHALYNNYYVDAFFLKTLGTNGV